MPDTTARFGIGLLEIKNRDVAQPGELMMCRDSGLTAVMNPKSGKIISYDYLTRFKNTYEAFKAKMVMEGYNGKLGKVSIDDSNIAMILDSGVNSIITKIAICNNTKLAYVRFGLDIEIINNDTMIPIVGEPTVKIDFTVARNTSTSVSKAYTYTNTLSNIVNAIYVPVYTGGFETVTASVNQNLTIDSFSVTLPAGLDPLKHTIVLHSFLLNYKGV